MFADHPLTGIGMGSFRTYLLETRPGVVNYYGIGQATGAMYVPDQPENGYLKILYEGGIVGSIAVLIFVGASVRRALQLIWRSDRDSHARTETIAALAGMTTFAITFVTLFTWTDARMSALFTILISVVWWRSIELSRAPVRDSK
jgi:O-antigen ligase